MKTKRILTQTAILICAAILVAGCPPDTKATDVMEDIDPDVALSWMEAYGRWYIKLEQSTDPLLAGELTPAQLQENIILFGKVNTATQAIANHIWPGVYPEPQTPDTGTGNGTGFGRLDAGQQGGGL